MLNAARTLLKKEKAANGEGRIAAPLAKRLGVHVSTLYQVETIVKEAPAEIIEAVQNNEMSIKKAYNKTKQRDKPEIKFTVNDSQSLPENVKFLRSAVILLVEGKKKQAYPVDCLDCQKKTAELLIKHFLKKNERRGFYDLLPDAVRAQLPRLPLVVSDD